METDNTETVEPGPGRTTGLLASLQQMLGSFTEILYTRLEILSTEVEEAGMLVGQLVVYVMVSVLFLALGLLLLTAFIIKASPEAYQLYVLGGFAIFYLLLAAVIAQRLMHKLRTRSRLFSTTLSELDKDRIRLSSRS
ncbi:MAG: phage holin family protein [Gammaproteobacteria bacterium]|jgi:uncharacterized membrane protein YqjE|nr:phage holin family protein [Gammaproteobacteria bacterium]